METEGQQQLLIPENEIEKAPAPHISKTFAYHKPSADALAKITKIRELFSELDSTLRCFVPSGRERAKALTDIESAAMWAIKSVVISDPGSVPETQIVPPPAAAPLEAVTGAQPN